MFTKKKCLKVNDQLWKFHGNNSKMMFLPYLPLVTHLHTITHVALLEHLPLTHACLTCSLVTVSIKTEETK